MKSGGCAPKCARRMARGHDNVRPSGRKVMSAENAHIVIRAKEIDEINAWLLHVAGEISAMKII